MTSLRELALLLIVDLERFDEARTLAIFENLACAARPGTLAIDLRDHQRSGRFLLDFGERLAAIARSHGQGLVINERLDLALCLDADGVHLREDSVPSARARSLVGPGLLVRACHRVEDVASVDADIVLLSPIAAARKGNPALGLGALSEARRQLDGVSGKRLFALGGIDATNAEACLRAGASGVAAISSVFAAKDPTLLPRALGILR